MPDAIKEQSPYTTQERDHIIFILNNAAKSIDFSNLVPSGFDDFVNSLSSLNAAINSIDYKSINNGVDFINNFASIIYFIHLNQTTIREIQKREPEKLEEFNLSLDKIISDSNDLVAKVEEINKIVLYLQESVLKLQENMEKFKNLYDSTLRTEEMKAIQEEIDDLFPLKIDNL